VIILAIVAVNHFGWDTITEFLGLSPKQVAPPAEGTVQVHFLDVGQGDAALILTPEMSVLIDSGESSYADTVIDYIRRMGVTRLDLIIATHPHADHIGGMAKIIEVIGAEKLIMPDKPHNTNTYLRMLDAIEDNGVKSEYAVAGQVIELDNCIIEIISPAQDFDSINDMSVMARLVHGGNRFLFTGDMEKAAEDDVLDRRIDISANVLKVSHHGSRTSSQRRFLEAVRRGIPQDSRYAIVSVSNPSPHNHPHSEVVGRLETNGFTILQTSELGNIVFESSIEGIEVFIS
jgi:competence protein ComEC